METALTLDGYLVGVGNEIEFQTQFKIAFIQSLFTHFFPTAFGEIDGQKRSAQLLAVTELWVATRAFSPPLLLAPGSGKCVSLCTLPTDRLIGSGIVLAEGSHAKKGCMPRYQFKGNVAICIPDFVTPIVSS